MKTDSERLPPVSFFGGNLYTFKTPLGAALMIEFLDDGRPEVPMIYMDEQAAVELIEQLKTRLT